jgi:uncharacterized membrane protein YcaP (DUF421 family)
VFGGLAAFGTHPLQIVLRTAIVYAFILVGLRLSGKREIGQLTPFDLVLVLLLANAVQTAMVGPDTSLVGGLISAAVLLVMNWGLGVSASRWRPLQALVVGTPTLLVSDGKLIAAHMAREGVTEDELDAALREHGIDDVSKVQVAWMEIDGSISVVPQGQKVMRSRRRVRQFRRKG